ncbi:two-component sensor histidine kinase [Pedobacter cryoconitis]|uniref:histidine kinase n=1 Tax=Pedobacter cryoconitis TaxID=188932 RepID=A0A127VDG8_9SPHI|nr:histidine kinase dimerization/phospho-acceptor domain-containing protein [Pedobacter cryoconitis]AMP99271.1 two-component sensor histidine kinase [Pedobacter cryoconitis]
MDGYFYKGLKFKIALVFSVVFIVINVIFSTVIYRYFKNTYLSNYNKYLYNRAKTIVNRTEINPDLIALPDSGESIRIFYHDNDQRQVIVFQSPGVISRLSVPYQRGVIDTLGQYGVYVIKEDFDGRPVELLLTVSNKELVSKLNHLSFLMITATLVSVLASAVMAYLAAGWLLRPIRSMAKDAAQINTSRLSTRLKVLPTHDELQLLTETINSMIDRIASEQELQNNFFAAASHELRTPLANLQAETELYLGESNNQENRTLFMSHLEEINRLQEIVEQFLLISQFKHQGLAINKRPADVSDQLLKVFTRNRFLAERLQINAKLHFAENIKNFEIYGDGDKLEVVWQNLLQNALKYAQKGSHVLCEVTQETSQLNITFKNKVMDKQFNVQSLTDAFTTNRAPNSGAGLGLWLGKQIVEAHHGTLKIAITDYIFSVSVTLLNEE